MHAQRFYCILSLETRKWMVFLYIIIGNMETDGFTVLENGNRKWMDWLAMQHVNRLKRLYKHQNLCSGL